MKGAFEELTHETMLGLQQPGDVVMSGVFYCKKTPNEYDQHFLALTTKYVLFYEVIVPVK